MKRKLQMIMVLLGFFMTLVSYQNCSLYKSQGKKWVEQNGRAIYDANQTANESSESQTHTTKNSTNCEPHLSMADIQAVLGATSAASSYFDESLQATLCVLTADGEESVNTIVCSLSGANLALLGNHSQTIPLTNAPANAMAALNNIPRGLQLQATFPRSGYQDAWTCRMDFASSEAFASYQALATDRLSQILNSLSRR